MKPSAKDLLTQYAERLKISARSYYRLIRVARTIADLDNAAFNIQDHHIAEALSYKKIRHI